jgi:hypothetical protein
MLNVKDEGRYVSFEQYTDTHPHIVRLLLTQKVDIIQKLSSYRCKKAISLYVDFKALDFI